MSPHLERLIAMNALIRSESYPSVRTFMDRFEVSERTVHADIAFLRQRFDAPLAYDRGRNGYYYTNPRFSLGTMMVSEGELLAFFVSIEVARRYLGTSFEEPLRRAVDKLAGQLPTEIQVDLSQLAQHYTFHAGATAGTDPALLAALFEAIRERWRINMVYFTASRGERNRRIIEPYHLYNVRGDWQVIAFDHLRQQFRNFAVSRCEEWTVDKHERFSRDPGFSPETYLAQSFLAERGDNAVEIVVWFDAYQAHYIRGRQWHPTQQLEEHDDGSLTLRFRSGALNEIRRWAMSYGRHARVVAPISLAQEVAAEARALAQIYNTIDEK
jgi:predicted DNA-binding transcriptional regulator YafY